jgi:hypothetical protein
MIPGSNRQMSDFVHGFAILTWVGAFSITIAVRTKIGQHTRREVQSSKQVNPSVKS